MRLRLWCDNKIKVLPSNSRDHLYCSSLIFFIVLFLVSFILNTSSFNFICYLINKISIYYFRFMFLFLDYFDLSCLCSYIVRITSSLTSLLVFVLVLVLAWSLFLSFYLGLLASKLCLNVLFYMSLPYLCISSTLSSNYISCILFSIISR